MPIGFISYINSNRHYGFIDSPDLDIDQIFFHTTNCKKNYRHIHKGDKVFFEFNPLVDRERGAKEIAFLQNASLDGLKEDFKNGKRLKGFLKKIDNNYYVKDSDTYIFIRLIVASYEINIEEVYEEKLNTIIDYRITTFTSKNKIRAININRQFLPDCKFLVEGNITEGQIVAIVKGGYQIKIYDNIVGFLPKSLVEKNKSLLEKDEIVNVICISAGENLENVVFDLAENIENEINFQIEQARFIGLLKHGDKYLGKITNIQGFGVFVSFGLTEGLLHITQIIGETIELSKLSRKEFFKNLEQVFKKEQEIEIMFDYINDGRISLKWDKNIELNRNLYYEIYESYINLKKK